MKQNEATKNIIKNIFFVILIGIFISILLIVICYYLGLPSAKRLERYDKIKQFGLLSVGTELKTSEDFLKAFNERKNIILDPNAMEVLLFEEDFDFENSISDTLKKIYVSTLTTEDLFCESWKIATLEELCREIKKMRGELLSKEAVFQIPLQFELDLKKESNIEIYIGSGISKWIC